jgi:hypothetical protein
VDNNGDAKADVTYELRFKTTNYGPDSFLYNNGPVTSLDDENLNIRQKYVVYEIRDGKRRPIVSDGKVPPVNIGPRSTPDYANLARSAIKALPGGGSVFAGQRDEGFYVDLGSIFDLGGLRPLNQAHLIKQPTAKGEDGTSGYNVHTIALQIPKQKLVRDGEPVIGVWATANRIKPGRYGNQWAQVSRLGNPLVNEVNNPSGLKDRFNATKPVNDRQRLNEKGGFDQFALDPELGRLIPVLYPGVTVPPAPRADLRSVFFTGVPGLNQPRNVVPAEMLRLNTSIAPTAEPSRLGVLGGDQAGFPNGRRVGDDVVDIELRAIAGVLVDGFDKSPNNILGDGVDANDVPYLPNFPYLGTPHQGYDHLHDHGTGS